MKIDADQVGLVFIDSLFRSTELIEGPVLAEGIQSTVGFHPGRLETHREQVKTWMEALPVEFRKSGGGGWSFLNACNDIDGNQWTGLQLRMEQLFQLGIGLGLCQCQMPKEMWPILPGGMPYYVVLL